MSKTKEKDTSVEGVRTSKQIIDDLHNGINKAVGYNVMVRADEMELKKRQTGILSLDIKIGGGVPEGRAIIYVGEKSTFKSSLMYLTAGVMQLKCGNCMTGNIIEKDKRVIEIEFKGESTDDVKCLQVENKTKYYSKKYLKNNVGNLFCPGEEIDEKIIAKKKIKVIEYSIECSECKLPSYSIFALIDSEHNYTKGWARRFGVINYYTTISIPQFSQQSGDILRELLGSGRVSFLGVDSLDALGPKEESEVSILDQQMGLQARVWNKIVRSIHSYLNKPFNYVYIDLSGKKVERMFRPEFCIGLISQYREKIGAMMGDTKVSGAGKGKDFLSGLTIELIQGKISWIEEQFKGESYKRKTGSRGMAFKFNIAKSKVCRPHGRDEFYFDFETYKINNTPTIIRYGLLYGLFVQKGAWHYYGNIKEVKGKIVSCDSKYNGESKLTEALNKDKKMYNYLYKTILARGLKDVDG